jgi:hypothetical protein
MADLEIISPTTWISIKNGGVMGVFMEDSWKYEWNMNEKICPSPPKEQVSLKTMLVHIDIWEMLTSRIRIEWDIIGIYGGYNQPCPLGSENGYTPRIISNYSCFKAGEIWGKWWYCKSLYINHDSFFGVPQFQTKRQWHMIFNSSWALHSPACQSTKKSRNAKPKVRV